MVTGWSTCALFWEGRGAALLAFSTQVNGDASDLFAMPSAAKSPVDTHLKPIGIIKKPLTPIKFHGIPYRPVRTRAKGPWRGACLERGPSRSDRHGLSFYAPTLSKGVLDGFLVRQHWASPC